MRDGMVVWDLNGISREDWDKLPRSTHRRATGGGTGR